MPADTNAVQLPDRAQLLLKALVERYAVEGTPVGSRTLARDAGLELSPATIRNVMADLEHMGFVRSPHTSAGRIPTVRGYRFFVDSLLTVKPLDRAALLQLQSSIADARKGFDAEKVLSSASSLLSQMSGLAGLVTVPTRDHVAVRQVEFMPLQGSRVLAVLVMTDNDVQNRVLEMGREYSREQLTEASNFLNQHFAGLSLPDLRKALMEQLQSDRLHVNDVMRSAIQMAGQALEPAPSKEDYLLAGQNNLMQFSELGDVQHMHALFETFSRKRDILHLLDRCADASGVQIFIGEEAGYEVLDECSVVTAPYKANDEVVGVLGVIGPTRMAYDRVIPIVDATARLLSVSMSDGV